jgi:hypothetical protein
MLATGLYSHTSIAIKTGNVIICGGTFDELSNNALSSCVLYKTVPGVFSSTGIVLLA